MCADLLHILHGTACPGILSKSSLAESLLSIFTNRALVLCHQQCQLVHQPSLPTNIANACWAAFCTVIDIHTLRSYYPGFGYLRIAHAASANMLCVSFSPLSSTVTTCTNNIWYNCTVTSYSHMYIQYTHLTDSSPCHHSDGFTPTRPKCIALH